MLKRVMGKAASRTIQDMSGQIQLYRHRQRPGKDEHDAFKHWDIGDIVGVEGVLFKTQDRRADGAGEEAAAARQVAAPAARRSFTASPTRSCATASATSISS